MKMAKTKKSPNTKELLKLRTKAKIINYGKRGGWTVTESGNTVWVGNAKCTFNSVGRLLIVE
jgi:hypothetical protein